MAKIGRRIRRRRKKLNKFPAKKYEKNKKYIKMIKNSKRKYQTEEKKK